MRSVAQLIRDKVGRGARAVDGGHGAQPVSAGATRGTTIHRLGFVSR